MQEFKVKFHLGEWWIKPEYQKIGNREHQLKFLFFTANILKKKKIKR